MPGNLNRFYTEIFGCFGQSRSEKCNQTRSYSAPGLFLVDTARPNRTIPGTLSRSGVDERKKSFENSINLSNENPDCRLIPGKLVLITEDLGESAADSYCGEVPFDRDGAGEGGPKLEGGCGGGGVSARGRKGQVGEQVEWVLIGVCLALDSLAV
ncbi:hypothetical protein GWI33_016534 [Rhynchophorus ferrugineus]|uniref:Uncharacterized protein n=1 Tax=Rhynchophorus ferrugineus TaxID=354439 RepID=A0A834M708_RHYFE|nr:hypothetical protein GWI33_016534 [Rhynchophorus ferrugineus]